MTNVDQADEIANLRSQVSELEDRINDLENDARSGEHQLADMEAEKIAAEQLAQEYKDALSEIESLASKHT